MSEKVFKKVLIIFLLVAAIGLFLVINKGHIGSYSLVYSEPVPDRNLVVEKEKEYISSVDKEKLNIVVKMDGEEVTGSYNLTSSDEKIVKITNNNEIQAVSDGKATIKLEYEGAMTEFDIKVITPIKTMTFTTTNSIIRIGKELQLKLKTTPSDASLDSLRYLSSDEEVATVNANGIVTGVSEGKVTITIVDDYTGVEKEVYLTVKK